MATDRASLDQNFKEFLESLNSANVRYLVLGGHAVNYYGHHRATKDLDVWIAVEEANREKVSRVMQAFGGFPARDVLPAMFAEKGKVFAFGREPVRIDILTNPSGLIFNACYARRHHVIWDGVRVSLIALEDLKANKMASGRPRDIADLQALSYSWTPKKKLRKASKRRKRYR